jgi:branched-subunit amino acid aminotransferase/4-amino-4-deoxychorismate lyase
MKSPASAPDDELPSTDASVDFDVVQWPSGLWQGDGVFETLRVVDGVARGLDAHLTRCLASCVALGLESSRARLDAAVHDALRRAGGSTEGVLRLVVTAVEAGRPRVYVTAWVSSLPGSMAARRRGLDVRTLGALCTPWSGHKVTSALGHRWAQRRTYPQEPLYVDSAGHVLEGATWNVFARFERTLVTPPCDGRILPGTARARLLRCAEALGCTPLERPLPLGSLAGANGVFATSALLPMAPILRLDGVSLPPDDAWAATALEHLEDAAHAAD